MVASIDPVAVLCNPPVLNGGLKAVEGLVQCRHSSSKTSSSDEGFTLAMAGSVSSGSFIADAYHISSDTTMFLTHSVYDLLSCETATSAGRILYISSFCT